MRQGARVFGVLALAAGLSLAGCNTQVSERSSSAEETSSSVFEFLAKRRPRSTGTPSPSPTVAPTVAPTATPVASPAAPSPSPVATPTATPQPSPTVAPTATPQPTPQPTPLSGIVYYFSTTDGDDARTAAQAQSPSTPWRTLSKLNQSMSLLQPGTSVAFKRGDVFTGTLVLTASGTASAPITLTAYGSGANPVLNGFADLTSWAPIGNGIYETTLSGLSAGLNVVRFNGADQPVGRWPKLTDANGGYLMSDSHVGSTSLSSAQLQSAPNFVGGELVTRKYQWITDRATINSQSGTTLAVTSQVSPNHPSVTYDFWNGHGFFVQNHLNALTALGDWAYDSSQRRLRMYFGSASPASYRVQASSVETLVQVSNSAYVTLSNLTLQGANGQAILVDNSHDLRVLDSSITQSGLYAIRATGWSSHHVELGRSTVSDTHNNAIEAVNSANWNIHDSVIQNTGIIRGMGLSGDGQYNAINYIGSGSVVKNNVIRNTGYLGIHFVGANVVIQNNLVDSFCLIKSDGGGIYTYGERDQPGRKIIGNIVINGKSDLRGLDAAAQLDRNPYHGAVHGIYIDGGASHIEISGNTVANNADNGMILDGSDLQAIGNTAFNNMGAQILLLDGVGGISAVTIRQNVMFAKRADQNVFSVWLPYNYLSALATIDENRLSRPVSEPSGIDTTGYSHASWDYPYQDGGTMEVFLGSETRYLSMDVWQSRYSMDLRSSKTAVAISSPDQVRFEYNAGATAKSVVLDRTYRGVDGQAYSGTITLQPYSSLILLNVP